MIQLEIVACFQKETAMDFAVEMPPTIKMELVVILILWTVREHVTVLMSGMEKVLVVFQVPLIGAIFVMEKIPARQHLLDLQPLCQVVE